MHVLAFLYQRYCDTHTQNWRSSALSALREIAAKARKHSMLYMESVAKTRRTLIIQQARQVQLMTCRVTSLGSWV